MARLVARALRLGSPALIQTESSVHRYCLSYLMPVLLGNWSVILVVPREVQQQLIETEIPLLKDWLGIDKPVRVGSRWQSEDSILLTTPEKWFSDRLSQKHHFPQNIPTIIDRADDLEEWTRKQLTTSIEIADWDELLYLNQPLAEAIRDTRVKLTKLIFERPVNRYECYSLENREIELIKQICEFVDGRGSLSRQFRQLWQAMPNSNINSPRKNLLWMERDRAEGWFRILLAPGDVATPLKPIWSQQPIVLIGSFLDREPKAPIYREKLGLPEILTLKFSPHRQNDFIRLFIPDRFPLANTPEYSKALMIKIDTLVGFSANNGKSVVILVEDVPLRGQVASALAAKYGTKVKVDRIELASAGILVCGWQFWKQHQDSITTPYLLIMTALPLPSLEHPLVASRVAHYKYQRQDWFRLYLLPTALKMIQQAIIPLRESQGIVALLDSRVNFRSYGKTILSVLEPCARFSYIDPTWFLN